MSKTSFFSKIDSLLVESLLGAAGSDALRSVREGLLWLVPCLLLSSCLLIISIAMQLLDISPQSAEMFAKLQMAVVNFMPFLATGSIGFMRAIQYHLPRPPIVLLCISYLAVSEEILQGHANAALVFILLLAIVIPLVAVPLLSKLYEQNWTKIANFESIGHNVRESLNLAIPGIVVAVGIYLTLSLLTVVLPDADWINSALQLDYKDSPYQSGVIFTALNSLFWFFGINGYHALMPLILGLQDALISNEASVVAGEGASHVMNSSFLGIFVFIGGSGATLSLLVSILVFSRNKSFILLAYASIPLAIFNVNELLVFGIPIILNPRLFIPFLIAPMANVLVSLTVISIGVVDSAIVEVPFNSPIFLNAYIATGGDVGAIMLQVFNVVLGMAIYVPFVRRIDAQREVDAEIKIDFLETAYTRKHEEAFLTAFDPILDASKTCQETHNLQREVESISDREFFLTYQPQINSKTGAVSGCEALIRTMSPEGEVQIPCAFLPWLEQAKLMKEIDVWVAQTVVAQALLWRRQGLKLPVSFNVTAESISDEGTVKTLVDILNRGPGNVFVEITEDALAGSVSIVKSNIQKLKSVGAKIYIDDFGTGFSSLSYLHQFDVDAIKIDRSFVTAVDSEKGLKVFNGVLSFARALGLKVVIEGVETEDQHALMPVDFDINIQGWFYSKAMDSDKISGFIEQRLEYGQRQEAS